MTGARRLKTMPVQTYVAEMQTYVAEIEGRAIFAFRAADDANAQAWLDVNAVMRRALETLHSNGRRIWNGQAKIRARKARPHEATIWSDLSGEVAVADPSEAMDSITVWLIPTSTGRHLREAP